MTRSKGFANGKKEGEGTSPAPPNECGRLTFLVFPLQYGGSALTAANAGSSQTVFPFFDV
jgi:hypothetical protein